MTTTGGRLFTQVGGTPRSGDQFSFVLAVGDFDNGGFADLAVGAHSRPSAARAVPVRSVRCTARRVGSPPPAGSCSRRWGGSVEALDLFGFSLAVGTLT